MIRENQSIEVEIVEIDGVSPHSKMSSLNEVGTNYRPQGWGGFRGKVGKFDNCWWPLWAVVGIIAFSLLLAGGLIIGIIFLIIRFVRGLFSGIFR